MEKLTSNMNVSTSSLISVSLRTRPPSEASNNKSKKDERFLIPKSSLSLVSALRPFFSRIFLRSEITLLVNPCSISKSSRNLRPFFKY